MDVKDNYEVPKKENVQKRTFFMFLGDLFLASLVPFKFLKSKIDIIKEDNKKIRDFKIWHKRERIRFKRGLRLNDEF